MLILGCLVSLTPAWSAPERTLTFHIVPSHATVSISNDLGGRDSYPVGRPVRVKITRESLDFELEAPGWKKETVPILASQFSDRWPQRGQYQMQPDSLLAHLQLLPKWPLLLLPMTLLVLRLRPGKTPERLLPQSSSSGIPWELAPGEDVQGYRVLDRLGEGVTAVVYRVSNAEGEWALKLLKPDVFRNVDGLARFRREMKTLCKLRHPGIPFLLDFGEFRKLNFLVMELLEPRSLADTLQAGPLAEAQIRQILRRLGSALAICHAQGILHRDIKPENVIWGRDGQVRLSDFGMARPHDATTLTMEGTLLGTPAYMAPEIVQGEGASQSSDQYSLGCLAYQMVSGRVPFAGENPLAVLMQHVNSPPEPLESPLWPWIEKTLHKEPGQRFATLQLALESL